MDMLIQKMEFKSPVVTIKQEYSDPNSPEYSPGSRGSPVMIFDEKSEISVVSKVSLIKDVKI